MDRQFIDLFTEEVMVEAGLTDISDDFKASYGQQLSYELRRRIGIMAVKSLNEQDFKDFHELIKDDPSQDLFCVIDFFKARLPNFNDIAAQTLYDFKCEIIEHAAELRAMMCSEISGDGA